MSSLKADFDELCERIRQGRELGHASFEPIYYLVFPPEQILEVKRQTPAWPVMFPGRIDGVQKDVGVDDLHAPRR